MFDYDYLPENQKRTIESLEIAHEYPGHQNEYCSETAPASSRVTENNEILD